MSSTRPSASNVNLTKCEQRAGAAGLGHWATRPLEHRREWLNQPEFRQALAPDLLRRLERELARDLARQRQHVDALRRPCRCRRCINGGARPFPAYYVVNGTSYECHLERQPVDPEMEELLAPLRNDRPRTGAVFTARPRPRKS